MIEIRSFDDALKDDSPEMLSAIVKKFGSGPDASKGNNLLTYHLISSIKKLNNSTTRLNRIMITLILVQVVLIIGQVLHRW
jgi:hypothetical protein